MDNPMDTTPNPVMGGEHGIVLSGLDGTNPLAFLAFIGMLRTLSDADPNNPPVSWWRCIAGRYEPVVRWPTASSEDELLDALQPVLDTQRPAFAFEGTRPDGTRFRATQATMSPADYAALVASAEDLAASPGTASAGRLALDILASIGGGEIDRKGSAAIALSRLVTLPSVASHQEFLATMTNLAGFTTRRHLADSLFSPWAYRDREKGASLRLDPATLASHALQFRSPSKEGAAAMVGANRLAAVGLASYPAFPTEHQSGHCATSAVAPVPGERLRAFRWPIWSRPSSWPTIRLLLTMDDIVSLQPPDGSSAPVKGAGPDRPEVIARLRGRGIEQVMSSSIIRASSNTSNNAYNLAPALPLMPYAIPTTLSIAIPATVSVGS
jgi:hypothetical protein